MGKAGGDAMLERALEVARSLDLNPRVQDMKGLRKLLGFSTQRFNGWKKRGLPRDGLLLLADKLGVSVERIRGTGEPEQQQEKTTTGGEMTDQEALLLTAFRQADEPTRRKFVELARQVIVRKFTPQLPPSRPQPLQAKPPRIA